jgi:hypothetical protein
MNRIMCVNIGDKEIEGKCQQVQKSEKLIKQARWISTSQQLIRDGKEGVSIPHFASHRPGTPAKRKISIKQIN